MFFDRIRQFTTITMFVCGSAAFVTLLKDVEFYPPLIIAIATFFSVVDLVVGTDSIRRHDDFRRRFAELTRQMEAVQGQGQINARSLNEARSHRLRIEEDEPPVYEVLDAICHNDVLRALGYDRKYFLRIRFYQRWFARLFDIRVDAIKP